MNKREIEAQALSGLPLRAHDVVRVSRDRRSVTLRHVWPESTDGRVWDGVRRCAIAHADRIVQVTGRSVEVYASNGTLLESR
jgi:hypothetical protein